MRPGDHLRFMRRLQRSLKVGARPLHVSIRSGHFRQNEERASRISLLLIECLLRQFLCRFRIARRQPPLRVQQEVFARGTRQVQKFRCRLPGELDRATPASFPCRPQSSRPSPHTRRACPPDLFRTCPVRRRNSASARTLLCRPRRCSGRAPPPESSGGVSALQSPAPGIRSPATKYCS